jgi:hypothetical protein
MLCENYGPDSNSHHTVFQEHFTNMYVPRALIIDTEPTCVGKAIDASKVFQHINYEVGVS